MAATAVHSRDEVESRLIASALGGDHDAFRRLTEPYYRALHLHCYRMLGSTDDAEDMVQETLVRAWRSLATHDAQASFRSWLYKIATNKCLKLIERRPARVLAQDFGPAADPLLPPSPPTSEVVQLDPYPNALLGELMAVAPDPEAIYLLRESIELAFLTAIQLLPARQRAVLILRDVLGWRTSEVAALMDSSAASVTSALQRARATMADRVPTRERAATSRAVSEAVQESVLASYMAAWEHGDMNALAVLLKKDALLTMAPAPNWFRGREAIANFFHSLCFSDRRKRFRLLATGANGQPACAAYEWDEDDGCYRFSGIMALTLEANEIAEITGFGDHGLFALFGLPETLGTD